jgi:hypothetical protein
LRFLWQAVIASKEIITKCGGNPSRNSRNLLRPVAAVVRMPGNSPVFAVTL